MSTKVFRPYAGRLISPESLETHDAIREQLDRILESPGFRNSKRYPALLRHVVERTIEGKSADLRERALAVDVLGRPQDYDPAADPVVRITAAEVRKRIAQYYHEPGHEAEIRIELPLGSYVPEFFQSPEQPPLTARSVDDLGGAASPSGVPAGLLIPLPNPPRKAVIPRSVGFFLAGLLLVGGLVWSHPWTRTTSSLDQFWRPVFEPGASVTICVARSPLPPGVPATPEQLINRPNGIGWSDVVTLARLTGVIQSMGQPIQIQREEKTSFAELQRGPVILVGAFNHSWTLRLTDDMRFGFQQQGTEYWITDRQNPKDRAWKVDLRNKDADGHAVVARDYALISRVLNPRTGKTVVTVAGLYGSGTQAAGRFLTDAQLMDTLTARAPANWGRKNLQVVLGAEVIDRNPGPPTVLATHFW